MNRRPFVAGNWKMELQASTALQLTCAVRTTGRHRAVDVGIIPSHPFLAAAGHKLEGTRLQLGAQDLHSEDGGALREPLAVPSFARVESVSSWWVTASEDMFLATMSVSLRPR